MTDSQQDPDGNQTSLPSWKRLTGRQRLLIAALLSVTVWGFLGYQLLSAEPQLGSRILLALLGLGLVALIARHFLLLGRTSLRVLVIVVPLLIAVGCIPARQVVRGWQLQAQLRDAGIDNFGLAAQSWFSSRLRSAAAVVLGDNLGNSFLVDLTEVQIRLETAELNRVIKLPTEHLALIRVDRTEPDAGSLTDDLVDWLNSAAQNQLVSIRLVQPSAAELRALSRLKQPTMLKLSEVALEELVLDLPFVHDLTLELSRLDSEYSVQQANLPVLERFTVDSSDFQLTDALFESLSNTKHVTFIGCDFDERTFASVVKLPAVNLTVNEMKFPKQLSIPATDSGLGRSLTTWNCDLEPTQLIDWLQFRHAKNAQIQLRQGFSPEDFERLVKLPHLDFIRIQSPWLRKRHLAVLTDLKKSLRLSVVDSRVPERDADWIKENVGPNIDLYLQYTLSEDDATETGGE